MPIICGIDPGLSGALCFIDTSKNPLDLIAVYDMPTTPFGTKQRVNGAEVWALLVEHEADEVWIENVWSRPGEGVSSAFSFGESFASVRTAAQITGAKVSFVTPGVWKADLKVPALKDGAREAARVWSH
ncbi:RuvC family protein [Microvirga pudoricolor]|uniref:hypothetical protein n=1 Tax=Microvirga pudoricolor TaxID=2778729 RepID=UPI00194E819C|nr:hypothetical protein [Microvirga pudoricolor]MBM6595563.1 hypothetical protein [Microvirga pudoricolor]